jgi:uncharacterized protein (DUF362 family)
MRSLTRREFLRFVSTGTVALAVDQILVACGLKKLPTQTTGFVPTATALPENTRLISPSTTPPIETIPATAGVVFPTPEIVSPTLTPTIVPTEVAVPTITLFDSPDLVVVRHGEPEDLVRRALDAMGGMGVFVPRGSRVIVKPNICTAYHTYEYATTTNPWVVGALVKLCLEAGASSVKVLDYPFGGTHQDAYRMSGIQEQVEAAGGEMADMPVGQYVRTEIPNGKSLKKADVFNDILEADVLINVPIAKNHGSSRLTLGMKNLMGIVLDRSALHSRGLGQCIADLTSRIMPTLTVVDAVRILTRNGPTGGSLNYVEKLDTIIVSPDIVAADSFAATLFGLQPDDLDYIRAGVALGLGRSDYQNLHIREIDIS